MSRVSDFCEPRLANLAVIFSEAAPYLAKNLTKGVSGVAFSILSIATLGKVEVINDHAKKAYRLHMILPLLYHSVINVLNPSYELENGGVKKNTTQTAGRLSDFLALPIFQKAYESAKEADFLSRHLISRGLFAIGTPIAMIAQLADFALGLIAVPISLLALGKVRKINDFAFDQLQGFGVGHTVFYGIRGCINPQQFVEKPSDDSLEQHPFKQRLINLANIPGHMLPHLMSKIVRSISAIGFSLLSVMTLGQVKVINVCAEKGYHTHKILPLFYVSVIKVLNPSYSCQVTGPSAKISMFIAMPIFEAAFKAAKQEGFLARHLISRALFGIGMSVAVITHLADLALGMIAAPVSLLALGQSKKVNDFACYQLSALGMIEALCVGIRAVINPHQK